MRWPPRFHLGLAALVLLTLARYGWAVGIAFINDDFLFLERARTASFLDNWTFDDAVGNQYRPLPRNLYFWIGLRLFGREPLAYHMVSLGLVALSLVLTALLARRLIGEATRHPPGTRPTDGPALIAALLFGLHPAAGTAAAWVCGVQDLLAVDLALGALLAHAAGRRILYLSLYAAALLSKETTAPLFLLAAFWDLAVARAGWRTALARQAPAVALFAVWLLGNRWLPWNDLGSAVHSRVPGRPSLLGRFDLATAVLTLRALFLVHPVESFRWPHGPVATAAQVLLAGAVLVLGTGTSRIVPSTGKRTARRMRPAREELGGLRRVGGPVTFAALWALSGVIPLVTLEDHAIYYAYYPALGVSILIAVCEAPLLAGARKTARAALVLLVLLTTLLFAGAGLVYNPGLRDAHYLRRATAHLDNFRADLARLHPAFPESSRVYFWNVPYWIGFQLADGPALRVWYGDPTLTGHFLSTYAPDPARPTFFFGHDDAMHLVETRRGLPDPDLADPPPIYTLAHNDLGSALDQAGEPEAALIEWRKVLAVDPAFADAAANLGIVLARRGRFAEAVPVLERTVQLEPEAADVRLVLGHAYSAMGAHAAALASFEAYLRLAPAAADRAAVEEAIAGLRAALARRS